MNLENVIVANTAKPTGVVCSFCGRDQAVVKNMVKGIEHCVDGVDVTNYICNHCIADITQLLESRESA